MPKFQFKNLPKGYEFPFTRHEIRDYARSAPAHFEEIAFDGIAFSMRHIHWKFISSYSVCTVRAEYRESEWFFNMEATAMKTEFYQERRAEIAQALLAEVTKWIEEKLALPDTAPKKPCRALVSFDLTKKPGEIADLSEWELY